MQTQQKIKVGQWTDSDGKYEYKAETEGLKTYTIGAEVESDKFGTAKKPVISAVKNSSEKDRFYVMALEDVDNSTHYWYYNAYGKLPSGKLTEETDGRIVGTSDNDFGTGKENTKYWLEKYGKIEGATEDSNDMWKIIKSDENKAKYPLETWFVPSKSEWSAFGDMLFKSEEEGGFGVTTSTYSKFGLKGYYWSSSQGIANGAYRANFGSGYINGNGVNSPSYVRLSATF